MGRFTADPVLDAGLAYLRDNTQSLIVLQGQPVDRSAAIAGAVHTFAVTAGDFTIEDHPTSGRQITLGGQTTAAADTSGGADHVAYVSGTALLHVTPLQSAISVTGGSPLTITNQPISFADPTA
jgi:hypothetical protein